MITTMVMVTASAFAEEPPQADDEPSYKRIGNALENKVRNIKEDLKKKATLLSNQLTGAEIPSYPVYDRSFSARQSYDFETDVRPVLDRKCVACHSCYEAPCQLNLGHPTGLERGASKIKVYDGLRLRDIPPTRLHTDAQSTAEWRGKGFFSVLDPTPEADGAMGPSLMLKALELGRATPLRQNLPVRKQVEIGLDRSNSCPAPGAFSDYARANPHGGMPLAVTGLDDREFAVVSTWLKEGAKITARPRDLSKAEQAFTEQAESWLNQPGNRHKLVARYLYEHLFLAHLYMAPPEPGVPPSFFRLIRSSSPPGEPAVPLTTVRPNDPPPGAFYYRIVPIADRIVHKTHITYRFDAQRLAFFERLFLQDDWAVTEMPTYDEAYRANPFLTFEAIPAKARYQFLLNNAEYFVRTFIRGPVCNGQVATYVIRDRFWVMFEDPDEEQYVNNPAYQDKVDPMLGIPGQNTSLSALGPEWVRYQGQRNDYLDLREQAYNRNHPKGPGTTHIWDGDGVNDNAFLTVFRHHTTASVTKGWRGDMPLTAWLIDYPLFERTYYELVVGFDVFANVSHQVQTRLYFDLIRNEGETNFLRLLPPAARRPIYNDWYQADAKIKSLIVYHKLDTTSPSGIRFATDRPKQELLRRLLNKLPQLTRAQDPINRCGADCRGVGRVAAAAPGSANEEDVQKINNRFRSLASRTAKAVSGIRWLPEVSFLRLDLPDGDFRVYSLLRNRRHRNVAFIFGESLRRQEDLDTLTILPTLVGSYPNMVFRVKRADLENFVRSLAAVDSDKAYETVIGKWGVLRMDPAFWEVFHGFTRYLARHDPVEAGIYDLNRYSEW